MRREELYLTDIVEATDSIKKFLSGMSRKSFLPNDLLRSAVLQKLSVIGEAASRLPLKFRTRHPEIEWGDIIGFRNIAVHAYFSVDWSIVWITARKEVPELRQKIADILAAEYPKSNP
jgi:uncharacterized protein with HEPN domain